MTITITQAAQYAFHRRSIALADRQGFINDLQQQLFDLGMTDVIDRHGDFIMPFTKNDSPGLRIIFPKGGRLDGYEILATPDGFSLHEGDASIDGHGRVTVLGMESSEKNWQEGDAVIFGVMRYIDKYGPAQLKDALHDDARNRWAAPVAAAEYEHCG